MNRNDIRRKSKRASLDIQSSSKLGLVSSLLKTAESFRKSSSSIIQPLSSPMNKSNWASGKIVPISNGGGPSTPSNWTSGKIVPLVSTPKKVDL